MYKVSQSRSLVNVSNSILKAFDIPVYHNSYKVLDDIFEANPGKPICLALFDGLGKTVLKEHKDVAPFLYKNRLKTITSVFPPTTVAATTSVMTGLYPCETGWLGWRQLFKREGKIVDMFASVVSGSDDKFIPATTERYKTITFIDLINERWGDGSAFNLAGHTMFAHGKCDSKIYFEKLDATIKQGYKFIYAYYPDPDSTLHDFGNYSPEAAAAIKGINDNFEKVVKNNPDVLFISLADHGHIDFEWKALDEHPDFFETLDGLYFCEARASMVNIKEGRTEDFLAAFKKYYANDFELYSKEEIKAKQLFGYSEKTCAGFDDMLGDWLMVAVGPYSFFESYDYEDMKSTHAGGTKREGLLSLCVYNND